LHAPPHWGLKLKHFEENREDYLMTSGIIKQKRKQVGKLDYIKILNFSQKKLGPDICNTYRKH
jgi:hypothetical protein